MATMALSSPVVQHALGDWAWLVGERGFQAPLDLAPAHPAHLARICHDSAARVGELPASIEQLENPDSSLIALAQRTEALQLMQALTVFMRKRQARKARPRSALRVAHPQL